jgi:hypothetical protein
MPDILTFAAYAKLDEYNDNVVQLALDAAKVYLSNAGVPPRVGDSAYDILAYALALHYYDNRGFLPGTQVGAGGQINMVSDWITRMITQLRIKAEVAANGST